MENKKRRIEKEKRGRKKVKGRRRDQLNLKY
jgi:hypothetical protein